MKQKILDLVRETGDDHQTEATFHCGAYVACLELTEKIEALEAEDPPSPSRPTSPGPENQVAATPTARAPYLKAVMEVMRLALEPMYWQEVLAAVRKKGLDPAPQTVRNALSRGVLEGVLTVTNQRYSVRR